jgi:HAD superfamily hydrolase (TIGR01484 family)
MKQKKFLGWIALDIDGTITLDKLSVPEPVIAFLREKVNEGWRIAMATGRPLTYAFFALEKFDFPYLILPQNGTLAMEMPSKKILFKHYIPKSALSEIELAYEGILGDFVVYGGYEIKDRIYWRPHRLDEEQKAYAAKVAENQREKSVAVESYQDIPQASVPLVKCFGTKTEMQRIAKRLSEKSLFNVTQIRDPHTENFEMLLVTDRLASKGQSLEEAVKMIGERGTVIAAGDDENDASLLKVADIKIAMAHAPDSLQSLAHFIAPPTSECGIIHALQLALRKNGK